MFSKINAIVAAGFATVALAAPHLAKRDSIDVGILQFALTLEHLEANFYKTGLEKYDAQAFIDYFGNDYIRKRFEQIAEHEATHVKTLTAGLGSGATQPCTYSFPHTDVHSFVVLSSVLEAVGTAAYLGAAPLVTSKDYLTAAGSILVVEGRHAGWVESSALQGPGWDTAFQTPLDPSSVLSLAGGFITSCPSSNPALIVKALPALSVDNASPNPGDSVTFTASGVNAAAVTFYSGLQAIKSPLMDGGKAMIPASLVNAGFVFAVLSDGNSTAMSGATIFYFDIPVDADVSTN